MPDCKMQVVRLNERTRALMCDACGNVTFDMAARFCPACGGGVTEVIEAERDVFAMAERYAYDVGFDEGYQSAMQEAEDEGLPD